MPRGRALTGVVARRQELHSHPRAWAGVCVGGGTEAAMQLLAASPLLQPPAALAACWKTAPAFYAGADVAAVPHAQTPAHMRWRWRWRCGHSYPPHHQPTRFAPPPAAAAPTPPTGRRTCRL
mgnify:CR=1 FL=1